MSRERGGDSRERERQHHQLFVACVAREPPGGAAAIVDEALIGTLEGQRGRVSVSLRLRADADTSLYVRLKPPVRRCADRDPS